MTGALAAMTRHEAQLLVREPALVAWGVAVPVLANLALNLIPGTRQPQEVLDGLSWSQLYAPTIALFTLSIVAVQLLPTTLGTYRQDGILRRLRTTPASAAVLLGAVCLVLSAVGLLVTAVIMATPALTGVGLPGNPVPFALAAALALVAFVAIGALITAVAPTARLAAGIGACVTPVLWFASGMWVPIGAMPGWLARVCELIPSGAAGRAMQLAMFDQWPSLGQLVVIATWAVCCGVLAARWFRWE
ncbi:MAG: ABC transporter permease [Austwickia sp.]|nr:ABC transporter permease [Austwickia sp.]MBK9100719.1 ABC transporter permease [Austwickia sp.]